MLDVLARNEYGFSINFKNNNKFDIVEVTGLNPVSATINSSSIQDYSGSVFNSAYVGNRNIVISIAYNTYNADARQELNECFIPSIPIRLYIDDYFIDGYTESVDYSQFDKKMIIQISIICLYPYFSEKNDNIIKVSNIINLLEFPLNLPSVGVPFGELQDSTSTNISILGDIGTGCIIEAFFDENIDGFKVINTTHNQVVFVDKYFYQGQKLKIDTRFSKKSIILTDTNGNEIDILQYLDTSDINFIELEPNNNIIVFKDGYDNQIYNTDIYIYYTNKKGGL